MAKRKAKKKIELTPKEKAVPVEEVKPLKLKLTALGILSTRVDALSARIDRIVEALSKSKKVAGL